MKLGPPIKSGLIIALSILLVIQGFGATSPTIPRKGTGGNIGPCTWFISLDGTTPIAEAMVQTTVSGTTYNPGDNFVGTAGQDFSSFMNTNIVASNVEVCLSAQTFTLSTALNDANGFYLVGQGRGTILKMANNVNVNLFSFSSTGSAMINLVWDGNGANNPSSNSGVVSGTSQFLSNIILQNIQGVPLLLVGASNAKLRDITVQTYGHTGITLTNGCNNVTIDAPIIISGSNFGFTGTGIALDDTGAKTWNNKTQIISPLILNAGQAGIWAFQDYDTTILGGEVAYNKNEGILMSGSTNLQITNTVFKDNSKAGAGSYPGIRVDGPTNYVNINGVSSYDDQGVHTQQSAIQFQSGIHLAGTPAHVSVQILKGTGNTGGFLSAVVNPTSTIIYNSPDFNPQGWQTSSPSIPLTGVEQKNTNPYRVRVYLTAINTLSAVSIRDENSPSPTTKTFTAAFNPGTTFGLEPGDGIFLTYSGAAPTWAWFGL